MMIDFSLPLFELGQKVDFARLITMLEFNTLALDTLVQKAAPEDADRLLDLAIEHAKKYHAAGGGHSFRPTPCRGRA